MKDKTEEFASIHLGKKSSGSTTYDPTLLVAVPRCENRKQYNIKDDSLPFEGFDVWHAYEFSTMTQNGVPITKLLKLRYNCESKFIIESKSLKLYLNSFNMSQFGSTTQEALDICKKIIEKDLSTKLDTEVIVNFFDNKTKRIEIFSNFKDLMEFVDESQLKINNFKESPELLKTESLNRTNEYYLTFDSMRSNCRVTHQPDFGDVFIYYKSSKHILETSLIQYLSSFRSEYHFHEECVEMIYKRLQELLNKNDELLVCALYTRRGGIDICPARWSKNCSLEDIFKLKDLSTLARNGIKQ